jgi:hypothetical protein
MIVLLLVIESAESNTSRIEATKERKRKRKSEMG